MGGGQVQSPGIVGRYPECYCGNWLRDHHCKREVQECSRGNILRSFPHGGWAVCCLTRSQYRWYDEEGRRYGIDAEYKPAGWCKWSNNQYQSTFSDLRSQIMGPNIFLANEARTYPVGFGICLTMLVLFGVIWPTIYYFILKRINQRRDQMSEDEVMAKYSEQQLADMGDNSPLFRYAL